MQTRWSIGWTAETSSDGQGRTARRQALILPLGSLGTFVRLIGFGALALNATTFGI
jgi:hypothetical protein